MPSFVRYAEERPISELPISPKNTWLPVNLGPYLDDVDAISVLVRVRNTNSSDERSVGMREVGSSQFIVAGTGPECLGDSGVATSGPNHTAEFWNGDLDKFEVYVIGEIHGPDVKLHPIAIDISAGNGEFGFWRDHNPTLIGGDSLGDVAAVIHRVYHNSENTNSFGLKEELSSDPTYHARGHAFCDLYVTGVSDNGIYQTYDTTKINPFPDANIWEMGYILKTSNVVTILDPASMGLSVQHPGFGVIDFSAVVPVGTVIAGGTWVNATATALLDAVLRAADASETGLNARRQFCHGTQSVALDGDLQAEYSLQATAIDFWLQWYELDIPTELFLWDADVRRVMDAGTCPTLPLDAGSGARSPLDATAPDAKRPMDTASDTETPLDAEAEPWREDS